MLFLIVECRKFLMSLGNNDATLLKEEKTWMKPLAMEVVRPFYISLL